MTIKQYRPAFCEGFEDETSTFNSRGELETIPWVANFKTDPTFFQFSISDNMLMAEYRKGTEWWVVGFFSEPVDFLPEWKPVT